MGYVAGLLVLSVLLPARVVEGQGFDPLTYAHASLERWVLDALYHDASRDQVELFYKLNPYYQRGDFDGDGQVDVALQVIETKTGKRGIAIVHRADRSVHIIGAGRPLGDRGDDFSWLWAWRVERPDHLRARLPGTREALHVEKPESASGWVIWNGEAYVWVQGGD